MAEITPTFALASTNVVNITDFNSFRPAKYIVSLSGSVDFLQVFLDGIEHKFPTDIKNFVLDCRGYKKCMVYSEGTGAVTFTEVGEATNPFFDISHETGIWTPVQTGMTLQIALGTYYCIGNMVFASFAILFQNGASDANCSIDGLPFTSHDTLTATNFYGSTISYTNYTEPISLVVLGNSTRCTVCDLSGGSTLTNTMVSNKHLRGTIIYRRV